MSKNATITRPVFVTDTREQTPWDFTRLTGWDGKVIGADQVTRATLRTGDYSLLGFEDKIAVERKSLSDLFGSLSFGRDRLINEIQRARALEHFHIIVEAPMAEIAKGSPHMHRFTGQTATRTIVSWSLKYPWTRWWCCANRDEARLLCLRLLERYHAIATDPDFLPNPVTEPAVEGAESPLAEFC